MPGTVGGASNRPATTHQRLTNGALEQGLERSRVSCVRAGHEDVRWPKVARDARSPDTGPARGLGRDRADRARRSAAARACSAVLALTPGRVVATDRLVDLLWGEDAPKTATASLQNGVAQLRKALGRRRPRDAGARLRPAHLTRAGRCAAASSVRSRMRGGFRAEERRERSSSARARRSGADRFSPSSRFEDFAQSEIRQARGAAPRRDRRADRCRSRARPPRRRHRRARRARAPSIRCARASCDS